jgi:hypothetical protein
MFKTRSIAGTALMLIGSMAYAQQGSEYSTAGDGLTREAVKAELVRAIASGEFAALRDSYLEGTSAAAAASPRGAGAEGRAFAGSGLTRAEVVAEFARARASGELERYRALVGGGN